MSFTLVPNETYWEEKRRQREKMTPNSPLPTEPPPVYYVLHGGGIFLQGSLGERIMSFDNLEQSVNSSAIAASREKFFRNHGGYLTNEKLTQQHNLSSSLSNITEEQIDRIRSLGGTVFLSRARSPRSQGNLPLYFYFQSNPFQAANE